MPSTMNETKALAITTLKTDESKIKLSFRLLQFCLYYNRIHTQIFNCCFYTNFECYCSYSLCVSEKELRCKVKLIAIISNTLIYMYTIYIKVYTFMTRCITKRKRCGDIQMLSRRDMSLSG